MCADNGALGSLRAEVRVLVKRGALWVELRAEVSRSDERPVLTGQGELRAPIRPYLAGPMLSARC